MARRLEKRYKFTPGGAGVGTVKLPGNISLNNILVITNVTDNVIIYSFAESGKGAQTSFNTSDVDLPNSIDGVTTLTLDFNTASMTADDVLQVYLEDVNRGMKIRPYDIGIDAVERMRVSNPQSLIDADFEYGLQNTKWQQIGLNRNYPSFYDSPGADLVVTAVSSDGASPYSTITVTVANSAPAVGVPISIFGITDPEAEGLYIVLTSNGTTSFTYQSRGLVPAGSIFTPYTVVKQGGIFDGASLPLSTMSSDGTTNNSILTLTFSSAHGMIPGSPVVISDTTAGTQAWEGNYFITKVVDWLTVEVATGKTVTAGAITATNVRIYARNDSFFIHRPFDGGVLLGPFSPIHGLEAKRQSKRYFRYQSGKGIYFSTGALFNPIFDIQSATYSSPDITITTQLPHGLQAGSTIRIYGITSTNYNGNYTVKSIVSTLAFRVEAAASPSDATAVLESQPRIAVINWTGASIRSGIFDDCNGLFWEYDGQTLYVVRRSSTFQLAGFCSATKGSNTITGTNTRFQDQLIVGSRITIRGQMHIVTAIVSQTSMSVSPEYRGASASDVKPTIIRELRVPSSEFNGDPLDGSGPSGYAIDTAKMQMVGIQYAWYGAGNADFVIRGAQGEYVTAHRFQNNNVNDEAYMRSGNLPARYEVSNESAYGRLAAESTTSGNLVLADASRFPDATPSFPQYIMATSNQSGTVYTEVIKYEGKSGNTLTNTTRATSYTQFLAEANRSFAGTTVARNHPAGTGLALLNTTCAPTISHWGSAILVDGGFDEDRGYLFNITRFTIPIASSTTQTVLLFRPAPSVSNTIAGALGEREVVNRSQLLLKEISVVSSRQCEVAGILNPSNIPTNTVWSPANLQTVGSAGVYQPSFAQYNTAFTTPPVGGELLFRFIVPANAGSRSDQNLDQIKEINNSIIGGDFTYPDGPEVLAIVVANQINQSATVDISLKWTEAQA